MALLDLVLCCMVLCGPVVMYVFVWSCEVLFDLYASPVWFGVFLYGFVWFCKGLYFIVLIGHLRSSMVQYGHV